MRKLEFEEWFNGKGVETSDGVPMLWEDFIGVTRLGEKWRAQTRHPRLKVSVHLGYYGSPQEAALAVKKKRAEFEEMLKGDYDGGDSLSMESVGKSVSLLGHSVTEDCKDKIEGTGRKHFPGVAKSGNMWKARARHPKLKIEVHCGQYRTPEEAAVVAKERKAEFEEMCKSEKSWSMKTCREQCGRKKHPYSVSWKNGRYIVRIWQPKLKKYSLLGSYSTLQAATLVAKIKRVEIDGDEVNDPELKQCASFGSYSTIQETTTATDIKRAEFQCDEVSNEVLQEAVSKAASMSESSDKLTGGVVKVPPGVTRIKSGKWVARTRDPISRSQIWLGTYNTAEEAFRSLYKKKAEFASTMERAKHGVIDVCKASKGPVKIECELTLGNDSSTSLGADELNNIVTVAAHDQSALEKSEQDESKAYEGPVKIKCELGYDGPISSLGKDDLNNIADDKSNFGVIYAPGKLRNGVVQSSSTSVFEPDSSNSAPVIDKSGNLDFDGAVKLGFINEYGQLLGNYSELDEPMELGFLDENVAATCFY